MFFADQVNVWGKIFFNSMTTGDALEQSRQSAECLSGFMSGCFGMPGHGPKAEPELKPGLAMAEESIDGAIVAGSVNVASYYRLSDGACHIPLCDICAERLGPVVAAGNYSGPGCDCFRCGAAG